MLRYSAMFATAQPAEPAPRRLPSAPANSPEALSRRRACLQREQVHTAAEIEQLNQEISRFELGSK